MTVKELGTNRLAAAAAVALGSLFATAPAEATTCAYIPSTLAEDYASAAGVVVAQVQGCAGGALPANGICPGYRYHLSVLEVLKQSVPAQDFSGAYQGRDPMGCGTVLNLGESYLLFVSTRGAIIANASGALKGNVPETRRLQQTLKILRDYRDGRTHDLAEPWSFEDDGVTCGLHHAVAGQAISFSYQYLDVDYGKYTFYPDYDEDGYVARLNAIHVDSTATPKVRLQLEGPARAANTLWFEARFDPRASTLRDSATVEVGGRSWKLATRAATLYFDDVPIDPIVTNVARGEAAREMLDAMREPRDVVVRKARMETAVVPAPPASDAFDISIETRTTHVGAEAAKFLACVDGSARRPPPAGL